MALQDVDQRRALNLNDTAIALHGIAPDSNVYEHNATMALEGYSQCQATNMNDTALALEALAPDTYLHEHNATMAFGLRGMNYVII
ncbi:hypothetical protein KXW72_001673 [Aspergillus fumigatus]|nr:hypothetical protein KXW72_001673 [Aspergillus fumigatus]